MLREADLFDGTRDKVQIAIERLRHFVPEEGYYLAFSGGKDSIVLKELARMSGVRYDAHYSLTTIDPPELVYYIRQHHADVAWERPEEPFLRVMERKGFPYRRGRWCCEKYKENGGDGRMVLTGIRWAESHNRSHRRMMEPCIGGGYKGHNRTFLHPIIDWQDEDVWEFIRERGLPYCSLYDEGWSRIGCLFCPMTRWANKRIAAKRYPRYVQLFIKAFDVLHKNRSDRASAQRWADGEAMFWWWLRDDRQSDDKEQRMLFE